MIEFIKGFFREGSPESMTRLVLVIVALNACALSWYACKYGKNCDILILGMLGLVITGKVVSKSKES